MMATRHIEHYRQELVGKSCRPVTLDDDLPALTEEMNRICRRHNGVGLAAPQIGVFIQLAILIRGVKAIAVLINPEITKIGGRDLQDIEGCLSLPGKYAVSRVWRSEILEFKSGTMENPDAAVSRTYKGYTARVAQHEIDHLNGIFFIDHCGPVARNLVLRRYQAHLRTVRIDQKLKRALGHGGI
jgi:peptide deformylase